MVIVSRWNCLRLAGGWMLTRWWDKKRRNHCVCVANENRFVIAFLLHFWSPLGLPKQSLSLVTPRL